MIPKIIHQTWKTEDIPADWQPLVSSWRKLHPDWQYCFWTDLGGFDFVRQNFPEFLPVYQEYSYNIQRADVLRYLLLYHYGGLYVDMDFECLQNFDDLLERHSFIIGTEPAVHAQQFGLDSLVANALIISRPQHPFIGQIIAHLKIQNPKALTHQEVLSSTGPIMVDEVYQQYTGEALSILPSSAFYPLINGSRELKLIQLQDPLSEQIKQRLVQQNCYAIHYWANSWMRNLAGELVNPDPYHVPGYTFYPGLDSHGNDIANGGRDILRLAEKSDLIPKAIAFNTDGFIKQRILPRQIWNTILNPEGNQGLYIKHGKEKNYISAESIIDQRFFKYSLGGGKFRILEFCPDHKLGRDATRYERK